MEGPGSWTTTLGPFHPPRMITRNRPSVSRCQGAAHQDTTLGARGAGAGASRVPIDLPTVDTQHTSCQVPQTAWNSHNDMSCSFMVYNYVPMGVDGCQMPTRTILLGSTGPDLAVETGCEGDWSPPYFPTPMAWEMHGVSGHEVVGLKGSKMVEVLGPPEEEPPLGAAGHTGSHMLLVLRCRSCWMTCQI